jgi:hypothetical protein
VSGRNAITAKESGSKERLRTMPRVMETKVFKFEELSDKAKEKAREWFREGALDHDWWDTEYDEAASIGEMMGISLRRKPVKLHGGGTRYDPAIYFSGFSSQGDGACFEAHYSYVKGGAKAIREYARKTNGCIISPMGCKPPSVAPSTA